jgi:hypothetical protein
MPSNLHEHVMSTKEDHDKETCYTLAKRERKTRLLGRLGEGLRLDGEVADSHVVVGDIALKGA